MMLPLCQGTAAMPVFTARMTLILGASCPGHPSSFKAPSELPRLVACSPQICGMGSKKEQRLSGTCFGSHKTGACLFTALATSKGLSQNQRIASISAEPRQRIFFRFEVYLHSASVFLLQIENMSDIFNDTYQFCFVYLCLLYLHVARECQRSTEIFLSMPQIIKWQCSLRLTTNAFASATQTVFIFKPRLSNDLGYHFCMWQIACDLDGQVTCAKVILADQAPECH